MRSIFHEFGHALHFILGAPRYAAHLSYEVELDFLEFPSQLLECWAQDFDILKMISCHYQTGEKIADDFLRNYFQYLDEQKAMHVMWEVATGLDSLAYDAFEYIKEQGLLNPEVGKKYTDMILTHGASKEANQMINFLGREPGVEAFHKRIAL